MEEVAEVEEVEEVKARGCEEVDEGFERVVEEGEGVDPRLRLVVEVGALRFLSMAEEVVAAAVEVLVEAADWREGGGAAGFETEEAAAAAGGRMTGGGFLKWLLSAWMYTLRSFASMAVNIRHMGLRHSGIALHYLAERMHSCPIVIEARAGEEEGREGVHHCARIDREPILPENIDVLNELTVLGRGIGAAKMTVLKLLVVREVRR